MKDNYYYLDTEFLETPGRLDLISIGIVCGDGRTFYAENSQFDVGTMTPWLVDNVKPHLRWLGKETNPVSVASTSDPHWRCFGHREWVASILREFIGEDPVFFAYYGAYDWVAFCWLFGTMTDLPEGYPMFAHDLKPMMDAVLVNANGMFRKPPDPESAHDALSDAVWNLALHREIVSCKGRR